MKKKRETWVKNRKTVNRRESVEYFDDFFKFFVWIMRVYHKICLQMIILKSFCLKSQFPTKILSNFIFFGKRTHLNAFLISFSLERILMQFWDESFRWKKSEFNSVSSLISELLMISLLSDSLCFNGDTWLAFF